jgi:hypothetical protein
MSASQTLLGPPTELRLLLLHNRIVKFRWIFSADSEYGQAQLWQRAREQASLSFGADDGASDRLRYYSVSLHPEKMRTLVLGMSRHEFDCLLHLIIMVCVVYCLIKCTIVI